MNYKLTYIPLKTLDIKSSEFVFKKFSAMIDFIDENCCGRLNNNIVWFIMRDETDDVFISKSYVSIIDFLEKKSCWNSIGNFYLYEFSSYEEAYALAVSYTESRSSNRKVN
jgi:hypothetical protein